MLHYERLPLECVAQNLAALLEAHLPEAQIGYLTSVARPSQGSNSH
jgi:hypothetical protein